MPLKALVLGVNPTNIRTRNSNGNKTKLYINAYYILRFAIYAYMQFKALPILGEFIKPTRGYKGAIARNKPFKQVILLNAKYIKNI